MASPFKMAVDPGQDEETSISVPIPGAAPEEKFEKAAMPWHQYWREAGTVLFIVALCLISLVVAIVKVNQNTQVRAFSVHAYQANVITLSGQNVTLSGPDVKDITLTGPFLGKIRVHGTGSEIMKSGNTNNMQSYCDKPAITAGIKDACNMMRIPTMYLGRIHSSWSVLGAQSVGIVLQNIYLISFVFSVFMGADMFTRWWQLTKPYMRGVRGVVLALAIGVSLFAICNDFIGDMHTVTDGQQTYAIGSISTGLFFWITTLVIVCCSQIDEVMNCDWEKHTQLHTSFLLLLLLPLFMILALLDKALPVMDVHVQLMFFSVIFFAVLDILQTRVMTVLECIEFKVIKIFVVLACILCKLFVFVPTIQLLDKFYMKEAGSSSNKVFFYQVILLVSTSLLDLAIIVMDVYNIPDWKKIFHVFRTWSVLIIIGASIILTIDINVPI
jgi:hypothetical protein